MNYLVVEIVKINQSCLTADVAPVFSLPPLSHYFQKQISFRFVVFKASFSLVKLENSLIFVDAFAVCSEEPSIHCLHTASSSCSIIMFLLKDFGATVCLLKVVILHQKCLKINQKEETLKLKICLDKAVIYRIDLYNRNQSFIREKTD